MFRVVVTAACVTACVAALAGCGGVDPAKAGSAASAPPSISTYSYKQYVADYASTKKKLTFPPGYPPGRTRHDAKPSGGVTWQVGSGATDALAEWNCAWGARYVKEHGTNAKAAQHALTMFTLIRKKPHWGHVFPPAEHKWFDSMVSKAELGDPSGVSQFASANCSDLL